MSIFVFDYSTNFFQTDYAKDVSSLSLVGVVISDNPSSSIAVFKNIKTQKVTMLAVGDEIFSMKLIHIYRNRVILQNGGIFLTLFFNGRQEERTRKKKNLEEAHLMSGIQTDESMKGNQAEISLPQKEFKREYIQERIDRELSLIMERTRFIPHIAEEDIKGIKITQIPEKSILNEIGIKKNDILKEINGEKLDDLDAFFSLFNRFKNHNFFSLKIERKGKLLIFNYVLK
jgi:type II secretion system protein C